MSLLPKRAPAAAPVEIRSPTDVSPDLVQMQSRQQGLHQSRTALQKERASLLDRQFQRLPDGGIGARVEELLGDAASDIPDKPTRIQEIDAEVRAIGLAIETLDSRIATETARASRIICDEVDGHYRGLVGELVAALARTHDAHVRIADFQASLARAGVNWVGRFGNLSIDNVLGGPRENHGALAWLLNDADDAGLITTADIPEVLRRGR